MQSGELRDGSLDPTSGPVGLEGSHATPGADPARSPDSASNPEELILIQNRLLLFLALLCFAAGTEAQCACDTRHDNFCFYQPSTPGCGATQPFGVCDPNGDGSFSDADWDAGWFAYQAECAGRCHCFEGLDPQERPIDPLDVPCGTQVCGVDNERWECQAGIGYVNIGTCDGCRCTDGRDQNDNPIPPEITYCGYETCGNSGGYWRCSPGGNGGTWVRLGNCPNAPPTNPPPTNPPPTNPPPTNPPPTNPPPTNDPPPNSGPNAPFGTNSATWIEPVGNELTDLDIGAAKGLGYHLTILGLDDDWANPNDKVIPMIEAAHARGITPILRLCVAENSPCSYRNEPERVVTLIDGILNSGAVDRPFYVIAGPNEPPRERWMYDRSFNLPDGAFSDEQIRIIAEDIHKFSDHILDAFAGRRGGLVRFLSPVLDCHNANTPRLIQALHNDGFSFHRFDGVGFNSYNLHGYLATRYFNHCRSYLQNITRTMAYDYYQTETGMFEIRTGPEENNVPRGQGLDNLRSFFSVVRREPSLKASLLFNGNARSGDGDFDYNEISSGEWDYVLSDCGTNCPTTYSIELTVGLDGFDGGNQLTAPGSPEKMIGNVWGPDGTQEPHAANPVPNQELLGTSFGAYRPGQGEIMGQLLSDRYEDGRLYTFRSFAVGGANRTGALPYLLGYAAVDGDPSSFVLLEAALVDLDGHSTWVETEGVTWATAAGGSEIGRQIMIVFGDDSFGGRDEVWVDDVEALSSLVTPELPTSLVAAFTTDSDIGVAPLTVTFSDTSVAHGTEITSWAWDFDGDGTVDLFSTDPESTDGAFTFTEIGVYDPTLTVTDGLLEHTVRYPGRIWATTTPSLEAGFTASSTVGTAPFAVAFTDTSVAVGGRLLAWAWDFDGDGAVDSTEANPVHIFEQPGTYPITLTVSTDSGLSASWSLTVEVLEAAPGHDAELDESFDVAGSVASWSSTAVISHDSGTLRQSSGSPAELFSPFRPGGARRRPLPEFSGPDRRRCPSRDRARALRRELQPLPSSVAVLRRGARLARPLGPRAVRRLLCRHRVLDRKHAPRSRLPACGLLDGRRLDLARQRLAVDPPAPGGTDLDLSRGLVWRGPDPRRLGELRSRR